jgi:hypothetical protein
MGVKGKTKKKKNAATTNRNQNQHMKTITLLAAMFLAVAFASPAVANNQVPFKGSVAMVQTGEVQGGLLIVDGSGVGKATKLGRFSMTYQEQVDLSTGIGTGTYTFVAANGDSLTASFTGTATPTPDPNILIIEEIVTITGGTGRFANATGTFTVQRVLNLTTGISTGSFSGAISHPGKH